MLTFVAAAYRRKAKNATGGIKSKDDTQVEIPRLSKEELYKPAPVLDMKPFNIDNANDKNLNTFLLVDKKLCYGEQECSRLPNSVTRLFAQNKSTGLLLRKQTLDMINSIEQEIEKPVSERQNLALHGKPGCGRSATMLQLVSYFKQKDYIVAYLPMILWHLGGEMPYTRNKETGLFDQAKATMEFLKYFSVLNGDNLDKVQGLKELVDFGCKTPENALKSFDALLKELASTKHQKVLFALDMFNGYFADTFYRDEEANILSADKFTLFSKLKDLAKSPALNNGLVLTASTGKLIGRISVEDSIARMNDFLKDAKVKNIDAANFNTEETGKMLELFEKTKWIPSHLMRNPQFVKKFYMATGGNPNQIFDYALFRPLVE